MTTTEAARFVRRRDYELLQARYVHHRFGLHAHDSFVLAVVEDGAEGLRVGDTRLVAYPGDVVLFGPGEAQTAGHGTGAGSPTGPSTQAETWSRGRSGCPRRDPLAPTSGTT